MTLPHAEQALVDPEKVTAYLLSPTHPDGRPKAEFFGRFGFTLDAWETLQQALRQHGLTNPVVHTARSPFGMRYIVDGPLATPSGRSPKVRSVWIMESGARRPRLVTAYPAKGEYAQGT